MAAPIIMPRQGQSVESCIIAKWHKKKGDSVAVGDILFSYETDKASFDEEAKVSGTLLDVFFEEGDDVPCLTNVCVIGDAGESTSEFNPNAASGKPEAGSAAAGGTAPGQQEEVQTGAGSAESAKAPEGIPVQPADGQEIKISPRARNTLGPTQTTGRCTDLTTRLGATAPLPKSTSATSRTSGWLGPSPLASMTVSRLRPSS
jgi:pyruvate dehydrogenase E2 component (dihydrolipoamide acetyltransferase)